MRLIYVFSICQYSPIIFCSKMLQHFGNNEKSFLLQLSIRIMGKTRNSAKQVISEPLARTKQASTKPAAQKARKGVNSPLTQNLLIKTSCYGLL